ncbi:MAG: type II toxin-antitoxin system CcdA family antitoxin [Gallionella sp.]|nr:type II toxin-antitoxin system CcdA family antitoxin [Gallionella sp.]
MTIAHFDTTPPKKTTNLSINSNLVREATQQRWLAENAAFIAAYNKRIEVEDLPLEQYRTF